MILISLADNVLKRTTAAVFSLNGFAMLVACCVRTRTLIPFCLALNAKFTSWFVLCFTSLEEAQSSRMISAFVPSYTNLIILSQSSIRPWGWVKISKSLSFPPNYHTEQRLEWLWAHWQEAWSLLPKVLGLVLRLLEVRSRIFSQV